MNDEGVSPGPVSVQLQLPVARVWVTYVLLGAIGLAFVLQTVSGGST